MFGKAQYLDRLQDLGVDNHLFQISTFAAVSYLDRHFYLYRSVPTLKVVDETLTIFVASSQLSVSLFRKSPSICTILRKAVRCARAGLSGMLYIDRHRRYVGRLSTPHASQMGCPKAEPRRCDTPTSTRLTEQGHNLGNVSAPWK